MKGRASPMSISLLYIPHSSDKTSFSRRGWRGLLSLYIPHSSDKTLNKASEIKSHSVFTSHIVQIKLSYSTKSLPVFFSLYIPHSSDKTFYSLCQ